MFCEIGVTCALVDEMCRVGVTKEIGTRTVSLFVLVHILPAVIHHYFKFYDLDTLI